MAKAVENFIRPYLPLDHYTLLQPGGAYPIVSLYLDSPDLRLCRESLEGHKNRFKLRIRTYDDDPGSPCFFEIKRRVNRVIMKDRAAVSKQDVERLFSGLYVPDGDYATDVETVKQFQLYTKAIGARPVVRIRYLRRAYEDDSENRVRITFDRNLCHNVADRLDISLNGSRWQVHSINGVILEIKFTGQYPAWLSRMAACFGLRQRSVSKYATSMKDAAVMKFCAPKVLIQ